jgi:hypothetical protein
MIYTLDGGGKEILCWCQESLGEFFRSARIRTDNLHSTVRRSVDSTVVDCGRNCTPSLRARYSSQLHPSLVRWSQHQSQSNEITCCIHIDTIFV